MNVTQKSLDNTFERQITCIENDRLGRLSLFKREQRLWKHLGSSSLFDWTKHFIT